MRNKAHAKGLAVLTGSPPPGQSIPGYGLAKRLAGRNTRTLYLDLRLPRENSFYLDGQSCDFDYPSYGAKDLFEPVSNRDSDFDMIRFRSPVNAAINEDLLERISDSVSEFSLRYDSIIISAPYGLNPISFLAAAMCEDIILIMEPDVSSIASGYCIIKALAAEGVGEKVATAFSNVGSAEQAFSLKSKFDSLTAGFLNLKFKDGGFTLSCREDGSTEYIERTDFLGASDYAENARLETFRAFQNETEKANFSGTNSSYGEPDDLKLLTHK
ncbi:MAG: hypothetical protein JSW64_08450 [Candidatus Zixiibacteriota bacterium]|nr:MAG: hypothetical protein JSW64_08450 [candidate division Zixibacteria bacterium]